MRAVSFGVPERSRASTRRCSSFRERHSPRVGAAPRLHSFVAAEASETGRDPEDIWARYRAKTTLGRLPTLDEIAWLVETLLASEADILHGSVLNVDAGTRHGIQ